MLDDCLFAHKKPTLFGLILLLSSLLAACGVTSSAASEAALPEDDQPLFTGKKVAWVDSYHAGYEWSVGLEQSMKESLENTGVELKIIHMDTKRNTSEEFGETAGQTAKATLEAFDPDVVIATDDNAQKFLVVPYLKNTETPVVFAGVNWDASVYGYPTSNVTGMVEVELPLLLVSHLKQYAQGERVGMISVDVETQRKIVQIYNDRFFDGQMKVIWADTWDEFRAGFLQLQEETDIVLVSNNAGINDWDEAEATAFFTENTKVPTGAVYPWMAPYTLMVLGLVPKEHGQWAAETALEVLGGTPISDIPATENKQGELILNLDVAEQMDIVFTPSLLKNAQIYSRSE